MPVTCILRKRLIAAVSPSCMVVRKLSIRLSTARCSVSAMIAMQAMDSDSSGRLASANALSIMRFLQ